MPAPYAHFENTIGLIFPPAKGPNLQRSTFPNDAAIDVTGMRFAGGQTLLPTSIPVFDVLVKKRLTVFDALFTVMIVKVFKVFGKFNRGTRVQEALRGLKYLTLGFLGCSTPGD